MTEHTRTYTWHDPTEAIRTGLAMSGLEYLQALIDGSLPAPPICETLGFRLTAVDDGRCVAEMDVGQHLLNPLGIIHGSAIIALLDSTAGSAVHSTLPAGVGYGTVTLTTNFLRSATAEAGRLTATGTVLKVGRSVGTAESRLVDGEGRLLAHATTACAILRG